jgi:hypothetical protein
MSVRGCAESDRAAFASMIASADLYGLRCKLLRAMAENGIRVDCPGNVGRNVEPIGRTWADKIEFMRHRAINLCPENTYGPGYVTEKLMQCVMAGAIPVYSGDVKYASSIFDLGRVIAFDMDDPNGEQNVASIVKDLLSDPDRLDAMLNAPAFRPDAERRIRKLRDDTLCFLGDCLVEASGSVRE